MFINGEKIMVITGEYTGSQGIVLFREEGENYKIHLNTGAVVSMPADRMQVLR